MHCMSQGLSTMTDGNTTCSNSCVNSRNCLPYSFPMVISQASGSFLWPKPVLSQRFKRTLLQTFEPSVRSSLLSYTQHLISIFFGLSKFQFLFPQLWEPARLCSDSPHCAVAWKLPLVNKFRQSQSSSNLLLLSLRSDLCCLVSNVWKLLFYIFYPFFYLKWDDKFNSCQFHHVQKQKSSITSF